VAAEPDAGIKQRDHDTGQKTANRQIDDEEQAQLRPSTACTGKHSRELHGPSEIRVNLPRQCGAATRDNDCEQENAGDDRRRYSRRMCEYHSYVHHRPRTAEAKSNGQSDDGSHR